MTVHEMQSYVRAATLGLSDDYLGQLFTWLAEAPDTGGAYSIAEALIRKGLEPPPHTHTAEDEAYFVLDGRIRFVVDDIDHVAGAGEFVFLPREREHHFKLESESAKTLILISPAGLEDAFRELSDPAKSLELPPMPDLAQRAPAILAAFGSRGVHFPPPPAM